MSKKGSAEECAGKLQQTVNYSKSEEKMETEKKSNWLIMEADLTHRFLYSSPEALAAAIK